MEKDEIEKYLNTNIYLILKNKYNFTGKIIQIDKSSFLLLDKFNKKIRIDYDEVGVIYEY